jgi:hypothetical protein
MNLLPHRSPTRPITRLTASLIPAKNSRSSQYANTVRQHSTRATVDRLVTRLRSWLAHGYDGSVTAVLGSRATPAQPLKAPGPVPQRPETPPSEPDTERDLWLSHFTQTEGPARHLDPDDEY